MPLTGDDKRRYQLAWVKRRRESWLAENGPCVECGSGVNLQVDHVEPEKKVSHRIWSWSKERREEELAKCRVLCGNCHTMRHSTENIRHGRKRYLKGCRCGVCMDAFRAMSKTRKVATVRRMEESSRWLSAAQAEMRDRWLRHKSRHSTTEQTSSMRESTLESV